MSVISGSLTLDCLAGLQTFYVLLSQQEGERRLRVVPDPRGRRSVLIYSEREAADEASNLLDAPVMMLASHEAVAQFVAIAQANLATHAWLNPPIAQLPTPEKEEGA